MEEPRHVQCSSWGDARKDGCLGKHPQGLYTVKHKSKGNPEGVCGAFFLLTHTLNSMGENLRHTYREKRTPKSKQDLF